jgi:hypothetical protein
MSLVDVLVPILTLLILYHFANFSIITVLMFRIIALKIHNINKD